MGHGRSPRNGRIGRATTVDAASVLATASLELALCLLQLGDVLRGQIAAPIEILDQAIACLTAASTAALARAASFCSTATAVRCR